MATVDARAAQRESLQALKDLAASAAPWRVLGGLRRVLEQAEPDYTQARALHRVLSAARARALELGEKPPGRPLKVAILAAATSNQLAWMLDLQLSLSGVAPEIHEAPFGVWRQQILEPGSDLYRFAPDVAFLAPNSLSASVPSVAAAADSVKAALASEVDAWLQLWSRLGAAGIQVLQDNFVLPAQRPLGSLESAIAAAPARYLGRLNAELLDAAPGHVRIHDLDHVASHFGKRAWFDERFQIISKQACALEALPAYAASLAGLVRGMVGLSRKCLVLDLDNTLWGGVVGDDGVERLDLGQGTPLGESFVRFQEYVGALHERGVVLAVCSKNDDVNARAPFLKHPEMRLKLGDIACFVANWTDKPTNLRAIAQQLRLGLDSFVFVDDNPAEREFVRAELPDVAVPELPQDPAGYAEALDRHRYFELATFTEDDRRRSRQYEDNARRQEALAESASDLDSFLRGLAMCATIRALDALDLPRATQLVNKSNQYNLTTRRATEAQMQAFASDPDRIVRTVRLRDRFGDNGLISVAIGRRDGEALELELWLMSCRVLARGVEHALLGHLWRAALARGIRRLTGLYVPTEKNALARDHYARLGFARVSSDPADPPGATRWELAIGEAEPPACPHIREES
jgi:FkbH-like protein